MAASTHDAESVCRKNAAQPDRFGPARRYGIVVSGEQIEAGIAPGFSEENDELGVRTSRPSRPVVTSIRCDSRSWLPRKDARILRLRVVCGDCDQGRRTHSGHAGPGHTTSSTPNAAQTLTASSGGFWFAPTAITGPRVLRIGARLEWKIRLLLKTPILTNLPASRDALDDGDARIDGGELAPALPLQHGPDGVVPCRQASKFKHQRAQRMLAVKLDLAAAIEMAASAMTSTARLALVASIRI